MQSLLSHCNTRAVPLRDESSHAQFTNPVMLQICHTLVSCTDMQAACFEELTTSMPSLASCRSISSELELGPIVHTIFVLCCAARSADECYGHLSVMK
jgi:hypothetical protein